jgi:uncharacterized caspase-like protein
MRALIVVLSVLSFLTSANAAKADRRIALVIGNGAYRHLPPLANAPGDARAMADLLRKAGFDVVEGIDVTHDQLTARLAEFGKKAEAADLALLYYAGQGVAVQGVNYLLPVDADIKPETEVMPGRGVNLDTAVEQTMRGADVRLVFLDASRNDPFKSTGRATGSMAAKAGAPTAGGAQNKVPGGTLIGYATGPGQTASDGKKGGHRPYTKALLDNIARSGVEIQDAMRMVRAEVNDETNKGQLPWGHSDLVGSVYLNPSAPAAARK